MKTCPYCAEEIQDAAIKCRYCHSDLTVAPAAASGSATGTSAADASAPQTSNWATGATPAGADATPGSGTAQVRYTHSGHRYVLGFGPDFFGLWDRQAPNVPTERWSRDDEGWRKAWTRFAGLEPHHVAVPQEGQTATTSTATSTPMAATSVGAADNDAMQYTHSGQRYLLGYGRTFFGIWDRTAPAAPVERFSRDDAGWEQAWRRFTSLETNYSEVGLGGAGAGSGGSGASGPTPPGA